MLYSKYPLLDQNKSPMAALDLSRCIFVLAVYDYFCQYYFLTLPCRVVAYFDYSYNYENLLYVISLRKFNLPTGYLL